MNLERMKQKYKQILEQPQHESIHSDEQWELAYSRMKNQRRRHILTESQRINRSSFSMTHAATDENVIKVKQKLAQALNNLSKKDGCIEQLKSELIKSKQQIKILDGQIVELKQLANYNEQQMIELKVDYNSIEKNIEHIQKTVHSEKIDKQLLQRQIEFYQQQIHNLKTQLDQKDQTMQQMKKQLKAIEKYKNMADQFKQDANHLRDLLNSTEPYKLLPEHPTAKAHPRPPYKSPQPSLNDDLLTDVEAFLKKQQLSTNNKQFVHNLTKFIAKHEEQSKQYVDKKTKKMAFTAKNKDWQRRVNHSLNFMEGRDEELKKSQIGSSLFKSRRNTLHDSKKTDSYIYDRLEKSLINQSLSKNRDYCIEILSSFRKGVVELTDTKQLKRNKLIKLVDWMIDSVMSLFPKEKLQSGFTTEPRIDSLANGDFRLQSDQIKISL